MFNHNDKIITLRNCVKYPELYQKGETGIFIKNLSLGTHDMCLVLWDNPKPLIPFQGWSRIDCYLTPGILLDLANEIANKRIYYAYERDLKLNMTFEELKKQHEKELEKYIEKQFKKQRYYTELLSQGKYFEPKEPQEPPTEQPIRDWITEYL